MGYDSDPRFEGPAQFDQGECINAVTGFYHFLTELPYVQPDQVLHPPSGGWPNITKDLLAPMGKSDEVVDLLRHLPYIHVATERQPWEPSKEWAQVAPSTYLIDYRGDGLRDMMAKGEKFNEYYECVQPPWFSPPAHVVSLTTGKKAGDWLLLDTSDGIVPIQGEALPASDADLNKAQSRAGHAIVFPTTTSQTNQTMQQTIHDTGETAARGIPFLSGSISMG